MGLKDKILNVEQGKGEKGIPVDKTGQHENARLFWEAAREQRDFGGRMAREEADELNCAQAGMGIKRQTRACGFDSVNNGEPLSVCMCKALTSDSQSRGRQWREPAMRRTASSGENNKSKFSIAFISQLTRRAIFVTEKRSRHDLPGGEKSESESGR